MEARAKSEGGEGKRAKHGRIAAWVIGGAVVLLGTFGLLTSSSDAPPKPGEVNVKSLAKIYVTSTEKWLVMVDYVSALPIENQAAVRSEASELLAHLSGELDGAGVDMAVLRLVEEKRWLIISTKKPRVTFEAHRRPDRMWELDK